MKIILYPQRRDDSLVLEKSGDTLIFNGIEYDFSPLPDGASISGKAVDCEYIFKPVSRINGELEVHIILPHGRNAPEKTRFPKPIDNPPDGLVELPPYDEEGE